MPRADTLCCIQGPTCTRQRGRKRPVPLQKLVQLCELGRVAASAVRWKRTHGAHYAGELLPQPRWCGACNAKFRTAIQGVTTTAATRLALTAAFPTVHVGGDAASAKPWRDALSATRDSDGDEGMEATLGGEEATPSGHEEGDAEGLSTAPPAFLPGAAVEAQSRRCLDRDAPKWFPARVLLVLSATRKRSLRYKVRYDGYNWTDDETLMAEEVRARPPSDVNDIDDGGGGNGDGAPTPSEAARCASPTHIAQCCDDDDAAMTEPPPPIAKPAAQFTPLCPRHVSTRIRCCCLHFPKLIARLNLTFLPSCAVVRFYKGMVG